MKFRILLFAALTIFSLRISATTIFVAGGITQDTTFNADTIKVTGDILIPNSIHVTFLPGTTVMFMGFHQVNSSGTIYAIGTPTDSIKFTYYDTTGLSNNNTTMGGWDGMFFQNTDIWPLNDTTRFSYCIFEYGKESPAWEFSFMRFDNSGKMKFSDCTFRYLKYQHFYGALYMRVNSDLTITNCDFYNNRCGIGSAIVCENYSDAFIYGCRIYNNYVYHHSGGIYCVNKSNAKILNNYICNNTTPLSNCGIADGAGAIRCMDTSICYIANNVIANNTSGIHGGGIECIYGSNAIIDNNTIVNNLATGLGGGIYLQEADPVITNNILWGNTQYGSNMANQVALIHSDSTAVMTSPLTTNDIENLANEPFVANYVQYAGVLTNNMDTIPQFMNPSAGSGAGYNGMTADWRLQSSSGCINMGCAMSNQYLPNVDLWNNPRISGWQYDIGAYEAPSVDGVQENFTNGISVYPNPSNGIFTVTANSPAEIFIYDVNGKMVYSEKISGVTQLDLPGELIAGIYFLKMVSNGEDHSARIIIKP
jgi:hypothetical protein